jgi:hypothetical protein
MMLLVALLATDGMRSHPLHSSYTDVVRDARTGGLSLSVKLFADDFGVALDSLGLLPSARSMAREAVAQAYFERSVTVTKDGQPVRLAWCGMRTADGLTWVCARTVDPIPKGRLRIRNVLMFDRFQDQISIVRWTSMSRARTLVLTGRSPEAMLD